VQWWSQSRSGSSRLKDAVFTVSPRAKGSAIADIVAERNGGSLPIVEDDQTRVGLVSEFDLLRVMDTGHDLSQLAATDILTHDIVTVIEEMPGKDVVHRLQERPLI
jgi:CBS domain-containing protein